MCVCLFITRSSVYLQTHLLFLRLQSFSDCTKHLQLIQTNGTVSAATQENTRMEPRERVITSSKHLSHPSCNIYNSVSSLFTNPVCSWHQFPLSCLGSSSPLFFPSTRLPLPAPVRLELCSCPVDCLEGASRQKNCSLYLSVTLKL